MVFIPNGQLREDFEAGELITKSSEKLKIEKFVIDSQNVSKINEILMANCVTSKNQFVNIRFMFEDNEKDKYKAGITDNFIKSLEKGVEQLNLNFTYVSPVDMEYLGVLTIKNFYFEQINYDYNKDEDNFIFSAKIVITGKKDCLTTEIKQ